MPTLLVVVPLVVLFIAACSSAPASPATASDTGEKVDPSQWSGLSSNFAPNQARFDFRYANSAETLYKVHMSTMADFSWDVYFNFSSGAASPIVQDNPHGVWKVYDCGATLYWRLEAVATAILSPIEGPATVNCPQPGGGAPQPGGGAPPPEGLPPAVVPTP